MWEMPFSTQWQDRALEPDFFREVNINTGNVSWPANDPYFFDGAGVFKPTSDDYDTNRFAPPEAVDHTDGIGGGNTDATTKDFDPPQGKKHEDINRAIDEHPIAQNYIVWHLHNAFQNA